MKRKKITSILLIGAMTAALLAGCGSSQTSENTQGSATGETVDQTSAETEETSDNGQSFQGFDELQTISMYVMSFYGDAGAQEVEDAINAISVPAINVQIEYHDMDMGTYMEQVGLMLAGGEAMDLIEVTAIPVVSFTTMQSQNELMDISSYLDEYAPEMKEMMADYLPSCTVDGAVYAIPGYRQYAGGMWLAMRSDILEALDLMDEAEAIDSWSDYEAVCLKVQEGMPSLSEDLQTNAILGNLDTAGGILTNKYSDVAEENWSDDHGFDGLGDTNNIIYVDEDGNVSNFIASEDYKTMAERVEKYQQEGLIYKDAATDQNGASINFANGVVFSTFFSAEWGADITKTAELGQPALIKKVCDIPVQAANANMWDWAVSTTSENPEAAVAFLNLMYTNADIENLFVYGIEGRDYEVNEAGEAHFLDTQEYMASDFSYGNQFLAYPAEGSGGDFREQAEEFEKTTEISPYIGFVTSTEPIANELTAVTTVLSKYKPSIETGEDISLIDTMLSEMDASGMQTILDYYQEQLDAWKAAQ